MVEQANRIINMENQFPPGTIDKADYVLQYKNIYLKALTCVKPE
jgi:hypothetical protein